VVILVAYTAIARFDIQPPESATASDPDAEPDAGAEVAGGS